MVSFAYFMYHHRWVEEKEWDAGLRETVAWYQRYTSRYADIEEALKAHPRAGLNK
jgi:UDP-glucose 4,6-dehydratase